MKYRGVAFAGFGGVGKSTATDFACSLLDAPRVHVKDVLGECVSPLLLRLGVPLDSIHEYLYGKKKDDPLPGDPNISAVKLLQAQGNGFLKECGNEMLAQRLALDRYPECVPVVNESLRFPREAGYLKERGLLIVRITRPGYDGKRTLDGVLHESERGALDMQVDDEIANTGTERDLFSQVRAMLEKHGFSLDDRAKRLGHLVVINGKPRSGKDDFCTMVAQYCDARWGARVKSFSTIDPVRQLLRDAEIDVSRKTPEDRRLLSVLGEELENHSGFKTFRTLMQTGDYATNGIAFIHAREPHTIAKLRERASWALPNTRFSTLWLSRPGYAHPEPSNDSDRIEMSDIDYDFSVSNSGTLDDLQFAAAAFADKLLADVESAHINSVGMARWKLG